MGVWEYKYNNIPMKNAKISCQNAKLRKQMANFAAEFSLCISVYMKETFEMVAKTMQGLEDVLAEELRGLGAENVEPGCRMVSFEGDLEMLYKANLCCRTALRILKPIYKFTAEDTDSLYEMVKEFDWGSLMTVDSTFCIDTISNSDEFTHSQFVTYRVKDAIVDWFRDRYGESKRPGVRLQDADIMLNVHIAGKDVTLSLDSSGESLHKRGYRVAQTEAPINEVLAAGIILRSGWRGDSPLVDPMCGSGTFLIEAALIAANINPGIYRKGFAFETWPDFDAELFDSLYNDDSQEREFDYKIYGADISPKAISIAAENIKSAGVGKYIDLQCKPLSQWEEAPEGGVLVMNPPYGERISADDMEGLYELIGTKLKNVFKGYHAWIIGYRKEYFDAIHLSPSTKIPVLNGSLECELREYIIFEGDYKSFRSQGGRIHFGEEQTEASDKYEIKGRRFDRKTEKREGKAGADRRGGKFSDRRDNDRRGADRKFGRHDDRREGRERFERRSERFERENAGFSRKFDREDRRFGKRFSDEDRDSGRRFDREDSKFSKKFDKDDRKFGKKFDKEDRKFSKKFDREERRFDNFDRRQEPESDNPLAKRRNEDALRSITNKQPSLVKGNTIMRSRRGWKKSDDEQD